MAIYHCSIKNISRSSGKSAVASSAYRSGEKLKDIETGLTHDYTKKSGIEYTEIILCKNAPEEYKDRTILWNEVQKIEKASNARLAREWELAIPKELSLEQGQQLVHNFGQSLADEGMCVDIAIHDKGDGNRHAHIMGTTRPIKENGEWGTKEKKAYVLNNKGERIPVIDEKTGQQKVDSRNRKQWKRETIEANDWNKSEKIEEWRKRWAEHCNYYLTPEQQVDHRSYKRQGKKKIPTIHEGYIARQIEQRGEISEICQINRDIKEYNTLNKWLKENIYERIKRLLTKPRGLGRTIDNSRETEIRKRIIEIRTRARQQLNQSAVGENITTDKRNIRTTVFSEQTQQREQQTTHRTSISQRRKQQTFELEQDVKRYEPRVIKAREQLEQKVRDINDKLAKYRGTIGTSGRTRPEAKRLTERSAEERLASLRSSGASRDMEKASTGTIKPKSTTSNNAIPNIGNFLHQLNANERASEEKRDNKIAKRQDRDAERKRQSIEAQRRIEKAEQEAETREGKYTERNHNNSFKH